MMPGYNPRYAAALRAAKAAKQRAQAEVKDKKADDRSSTS
jgi:hypothetical protein